jgi:hypothetical protein
VEWLQGGRRKKGIIDKRHLLIPRRNAKNTLEVAGAECSPEVGEIA